MNPYQDWTRAKLSEDPNLTYAALRRLLEQEHAASVETVTMKRWHYAMKKPSKRGADAKL